MMSKKILITLSAVLVVGAFWIVFAQEGLTPQEQLGKNLFFDTDLSDPPGQSCADCHAPGVGWTGPDQAINAAGAVYEGAVPGRFGNRKPPASAYAGDSPYCTLMEPIGLAACSGMAGPPGRGWVTPWLNRPKGPS